MDDFRIVNLSIILALLYIVSCFSYDLILLGILKTVTLGDFFMCVMKDVVRRNNIKLAYRDRRSAYTFNLSVIHTTHPWPLIFGYHLYAPYCVPSKG